ncbi:hypothetical protein PP761_gp12 [Stenotrophomonas phage Paxi]|uniref:Uncharacterized protein n=1 Tax=Stenotrophomonas phage Paxi TaxID=2859653 RepID=A0AAE8BLC5_9CAUD|nr:hypothetical protein PP761_gp12 [Stenotrophomonas phage Paxi]QYW01783.1 hypothetical protein CPT_Paxi_012 [Stenotrophomonas phage Paxi]
MKKTIFVFGSNEGGIHGAGAALFAYQKKGARFGHGYGHSGNSWAIPTKGVLTIGDNRMVGDTLPLERIQQYVAGFLAFAHGHPDMEFEVTRIGCGLAGLKDEDIAPMFHNAPSNCSFDTVWKPWLKDDAKFWGTF